MVRQDLDVWSSLRKTYLPLEYHKVYDVIAKHIDAYSALPSIEQLKLFVRDRVTTEKVYAIESIEVDAEPFLLLEYLKGEFTQIEALSSLNEFVENSISFSSPNEVVEALYDIISELEQKVEIEDPKESMQNIELFDDDDIVDNYATLGLNAEFDEHIKFRPTDYVLIGGKRGDGKSVTVTNIAANMIDKDKSVIFFTIEMPTREVLQRLCAVSAGIPFSKLKYKDLSITEWERVAAWWAKRFKNSEQHYKDYLEHRSFDKFHAAISKEPLSDVRIEVVYDPTLTLGKLKAEAIKRSKLLDNLGLIVVDYLNQVSLTNESANSMYDWKDQVTVSKGLKALASMLEALVISPYQIDALGEARFSKGILDSADFAFIISAGSNFMDCKCTKSRADAARDFCSKVDWDILKIGPMNHKIEKPEETEKPSKNKFSQDKSRKIYDDASAGDPPF